MQEYLYTSQAQQVRVRAVSERLEFTPLRFTAEELTGLLGQGKERDCAQNG